MNLVFIPIFFRPALTLLLCLIGCHSAFAEISIYPNYNPRVIAPTKIFEKSLNDAIWNPQVSKEFRDRYRDTFGAIDTGQAAWYENSFQKLDLLRPMPGNEADAIKKRDFAEYMSRRLIEFHTENFIKTEPTLKPAYELKQKISHAEVQIRPDIKFKTDYNFAANTLDVSLLNPYCDTHLYLIMDPKAYMPTAPTEERLMLGRNLNQYNRAQFHIQNVAKDYVIEWIKVYRNKVSQNISYADNYLLLPNQVPNHRISLGLSLGF